VESSYSGGVLLESGLGERGEDGTGIGYGRGGSGEETLRIARLAEDSWAKDGRHCEDGGLVTDETRRIQQDRVCD